MTIHPQHDRILIKRDDTEPMTRGGIILPDQTKEKPLRGIIVAIGPGKKLPSPLVPKGYVLEPISFEIGQHVLFLKYAGDSYKFDGEELFFVKADDIIGIIDDDESTDGFTNAGLTNAGRAIYNKVTA